MTIEQEFEQYQPEKVTSLTLRKYFGSLYFNRFGKSYKSNNFVLDLTMLKRLLNKYSQYLIMEAMDLFVRSTPEIRCTLNIFCYQKTFEKRFADLLKINSIVKYKRMLPVYGNLNLQVKMQKLLKEYEDIALASSISTKEAIRLEEILKIMEYIHEKFVKEE